MRAIRVLAIGTMGLVVAYFGFRDLVARCSGAVCDIYIPFSLLLPLLILGMTAMTGILSSLQARRYREWFPMLLTSTGISVLGPLAALAVFRDRPGEFVFAGTALVVIAPAVALAFTLIEGRRLGGTIH